MFWKFLRESIWRPGSRHHALWAVVAISLGTAITAAVLSVSLDVGDKMGKELRSLGANVVVTPVADSLPVEIGGIDYRPVSEGSFIEESSLSKLKEIFWRNNIVAFAPFLYVPVTVEGGAANDAAKSTTLVGTWFSHSFSNKNGENFHTGVRELNASWKIDGEWIDDRDSASADHDCVLGVSFARTSNTKVGAELSIHAAASKEANCKVKGILTTGTAEDNQVLTSLAFAQSLSGLEGKARNVRVSALVKPEDEKSKRDPKSMTPAEFESWYCSPYISSILLQIREALPGTAARQIQAVAETEGKVLNKLTFLMGTLAVVALIAAALSISSIAGLRVMKRRQEISVMKAIGAQDRLVATLFLAEAAIQGLVGGVLGFGVGLVLARALEMAVFDSKLTVNWLLLPLILLAGLIVSFAGTWGPLKVAMSFEPATVLRGE